MYTIILAKKLSNGQYLAGCCKISWLSRFKRIGTGLLSISINNIDLNQRECYVLLDIVTRINVFKKGELMIKLAMIILALCGFLISSYSFFIELRLKKDRNYKPACDLSDYVSCSTPVMSEYGKIFGFSNALTGIIYYFLIIFSVIMRLPYVVFVLAVTGLFVSFFLAWLLYFRIRTFCLLCSLTYVVNIILAILSFITL